MKPYRYFQATAITFALVFASSAPAYCQSPQNNPAPASQPQNVKDQIQKFGMAEDITVILLSGLEYYGAISKIEPDSFEIAEVDLRQMVTIAYTDVLRVEKGYGAMDSSTGKRHKPLVHKPYRSRAVWIALVATLGSMVGLAVWAIRRHGKQRPASPFPRFP
jgi:hypothetical protein